MYRDARATFQTPTWPQRFEFEQQRIEAALGVQALSVEHIGSTSVFGLVAKPIIDICVVVEDSSDEASYVPDLEAVGYELRVREPDWHEHRMLRTAAHDVHVHVFTFGSAEIDRHLAFRDCLRANDDVAADPRRLWTGSAGPVHRISLGASTEAQWRPPGDGWEVEHAERSGGRRAHRRDRVHDPIACPRVCITS